MAHKPNKAMKKKREKYNSTGRYWTNKLKRIIRHLKRLPNDKIAEKKLEQLQAK